MEQGEVCAHCPACFAIDICILAESFKATYYMASKAVITNIDSNSILHSPQQSDSQLCNDIRRSDYFEIESCQLYGRWNICL